MFVPIDLLEPVLEDMIELGGRGARRVLGSGCTRAEQADHVMVAGLTRDGPAHRAGVRLGDVIVEVADTASRSLPQFFRSVWNSRRRRGRSGPETDARRRGISRAAAIGQRATTS
jgi:S1-C subfamily serine protease